MATYFCSAAAVAFAPRGGRRAPGLGLSSRHPSLGRRLGVIRGQLPFRQVSQPNPPDFLSSASSWTNLFRHL